MSPLSPSPQWFTVSALRGVSTSKTNGPGVNMLAHTTHKPYFQGQSVLHALKTLLTRAYLPAVEKFRLVIETVRPWWDYHQRALSAAVTSPCERRHSSTCLLHTWKDGCVILGLSDTVCCVHMQGKQRHTNAHPHFIWSEARAHTRTWRRTTEIQSRLDSSWSFFGNSQRLYHLLRLPMHLPSS